jgi:hypothetical protein
MPTSHAVSESRPPDGINLPGSAADDPQKLRPQGQGRRPFSHLVMAGHLENHLANVRDWAAYFHSRPTVI